MGYISALLSFIVMGLVYSNIYFIKQNERLKLQFQDLQAHLDTQNKMIEAIALDTDSYVCDLDTMEAYTRAKYDKIIHEHEEDSCEIKLQSLQEALELF